MKKSDIKLGQKRRLLVAVVRDQKRAQQVVEELIEQDFPMDSLSMLGRAGSSGDDLLGISYNSVGEKMKSWGTMGAFWGGLWGLLSGAAGMFILPGLGPIVAAGPIVEAIAGAISGAALAGGTMAGAAALSEITVAIHQLGVPEEKLHHLHEAIEQGHYVLILRCATDEAEYCRNLLSRRGDEEVEEFPYLP
ncbi:MAG TPA: hypothetical protein VGE50_11815 [Gammaproteobacteria bacterium]